MRKLSTFMLLPIVCVGLIACASTNDRMQETTGNSDSWTFSPHPTNSTATIDIANITEPVIVDGMVIGNYENVSWNLPANEYTEHVSVYQFDYSWDMDIDINDGVHESDFSYAFVNLNRIFGNSDSVSDNSILPTNQQRQEVVESIRNQSIDGRFDYLSEFVFYPYATVYSLPTDVFQSMNNIDVGDSGEIDCYDVFQTIDGLPIIRLHTDENPNFIAWNDSYFGQIYSDALNAYYDGDSIYILGSAHMNNMIEIDAQFAPVSIASALPNAVQAILYQTQYPSESICIYDARLAYVMVHKWKTTGLSNWFEDNDFQGNYVFRHLLIPVWYFEYSVNDDEGFCITTGSVCMRADNGENAVIDDTPYVPYLGI